MNVQKHPEKHDEFNELVNSIHTVEAESDKIKATYTEKVAELLKYGREKSVELRESYEKKASESKNELIVAEREKTEKLVEEIISSAKKDALVLRVEKLNKKNIDAIFESFVSSVFR